MLARERFDLVLMDVQMPEMDGLEACRRIRQGGDGVLDRTVSIIAMTAHAMKGDRERFLEEGMDDYVSKPVEPKDLLAAMDRVMRRRAETEEAGPPDRTEPALPVETVAAPAPSPAPAGPPADPPLAPSGADVLDHDSAIRRLRGDEAFLRVLYATFLDDAPAKSAALDEAAAQGQEDKLLKLIHSIHGAAGTIGAPSLKSMAHQMERLARNQEFDAVRSGLDRLKTELARVENAIRSRL